MTEHISQTEKKKPKLIELFKELFSIRTGAGTTWSKSGEVDVGKKMAELTTELVKRSPDTILIGLERLPDGGFEINYRTERGK